MDPSRFPPVWALAVDGGATITLNSVMITGGGGIHAVEIILCASAGPITLMPHGGDSGFLSQGA